MKKERVWKFFLVGILFFVALIFVSQALNIENQGEMSVDELKVKLLGEGCDVKTGPDGKLECGSDEGIRDESDPTFGTLGGDKWCKSNSDGTLVNCDQNEPNGGSGTVTSVATGAGLLGGPIISAGTISADPNYLQRRVTNPCPMGEAIRVINSDGSVVCQSAGTGPIAWQGSGNIYYNGGLVGIGTSSPQKKLQIKGDGGVLGLEGSTHSFVEFFPKTYGNGRKAWLGFGSPTSNDFTISASESSSSANIIIMPGVEGRVGVGTSPGSGYKLDVAGQTHTDSLAVGGLSCGVTACVGGNMDVSGDLINHGGKIKADYVELGGTNNEGYRLYVESTGVPIRAVTANDGSPSNIQSWWAGAGSSSPVAVVQYNGIYLVTSDLRLKENIISFKDKESLDKIMKLNPVSFKWKSDKSSSVGFVAQEVNKIIPEVVTLNDDGYYMVGYDEFTPYLVSSIQEQQKQIEELKTIVCADHPDAKVCN